MFKVDISKPPICPPLTSHTVSNGFLGAIWQETEESKQTGIEYEQYLREYGATLNNA